MAQSADAGIAWGGRANTAGSNTTADRLRLAATGPSGSRSANRRLTIMGAMAYPRVATRTRAAPSATRAHATKAGGTPASTATRMKRYGTPQTPELRAKSHQARGVMPRRTFDVERGGSDRPGRRGTKDGPAACQQTSVSQLLRPRGKRVGGPAPHELVHIPEQARVGPERRQVLEQQRLVTSVPQDRRGKVLDPPVLVQEPSR